MRSSYFSALTLGALNLATLTLAVLGASTARVAWASCDVTEVGSQMVGERIRDVEVDGDQAFLAAGYDGLIIVNVATPTAPWIEGTLILGGFAQDVEIDGNVAYVASSDYEIGGGLYVVDITNRASPSQLGQFGSSFSRVVIDSGTAYAIDPSTGLSLIDVSTPTTPTLLSTLDLAGNENDVALAGTSILVATDANDEPSSIRTVDATNPLLPVEVNVFDTGNRIPYSLQVAGTTAYISATGDALRGLIVSDVTNPLAQAEHSFLPQPNARASTVSGTRGYFGFGIDHSFGGGIGGLRVLDLSNLAIPVPVGSADTSTSETAALALVNEPALDRVFAATSGDQAGLRIYEVANCPSVTPIDVIPNSTDNWIPLTLDIELAVDILGSPGFDVTTVDLNSLAFGPGLAPHLTTTGFAPVIADQNSDGIDDVRVHFQQSAAGLTAIAAQGCLQFITNAQDFAACDWVTPNFAPTSAPFVDLFGGFAPLTVDLSGTASSDPEGDTLNYIWTYSDGAPPDVGEFTSRTYTEYGEHVVTLTVTDSHGQVDSQVLEFTIYFDSDGDGIADIFEFGPDPLNPVDTDGDGLADYLDLDSDNDGLLDHEEDINLNGSLNSVKSYLVETDRLQPDTDLDGFTDYVEVTMGTNPRDDTSFPVIVTAPALAPMSTLALLALFVVTAKKTFKP